MYGKDAVEFAWGAIQGRNPFYNLPASDETLANFSEHQKLLAAYAKIAKRQNVKIGSKVRSFLSVFIRVKQFTLFYFC